MEALLAPLLDFLREESAWVAVVCWLLYERYKGLQSMTIAIEQNTRATSALVDLLRK